MFHYQNKSGNIEITISFRQVLKALELSLTISCSVMQYYSFTDMDFWQNMLVYGVFCMYLNIIPVLISSSFLKYRTPVYVDAMYSLVGCVLFLLNGILGLTLDTKNNTGLRQSKYYLAIVNAFVMFVDLFKVIVIIYTMDMIGESTSKLHDLMFSLVGSAMFWAAGGVGLEELGHGEEHPKVIRLKSRLAVINGCVLLVDVLFVNALLCITNLIHRYLIGRNDITRIHNRFIEIQDLEL